MMGKQRTKIIAGDQIISEVDILANEEYYEGKARPTLCVVSDFPLTDDQINAMVANDWHLMEQDKDGVEVEKDVRRGYNAVFSYQTVFVQVETPDEREAALRQRIAELEAANAAVEGALFTLQKQVTPITKGETENDLGQSAAEEPTL